MMKGTYEKFLHRKRPSFDAQHDGRMVEIKIKIIRSATAVRKVRCKVIHQDLGLKCRAHQHKPQIGSEGQQIP